MKKMLCLMTVFLFAFAVSCTSGKEQQSSGEQGTIQVISPQQAKEMMDSTEVVILDVRTREEYAQGHIPGSVLIPVDEIDSSLPEVLPDLEQPVLIYCRSGNRSKTASRKLKDLGYTVVYDFGGILDWPFEVVTQE